MFNFNLKNMDRTSFTDGDLNLRQAACENCCVSYMFFKQILKIAKRKYLWMSGS